VRHSPKQRDKSMNYFTCSLSKTSMHGAVGPDRSTKKEKTMSTETLGAFLLDTARGKTKESKIPDTLATEINAEMSKRIAPKIEEIRKEQRKALEDSKSVTLV
jgi:hypothetical protein